MEAGAHTWGARPSEFLTVRDKVRSPLYNALLNTIVSTQYCRRHILKSYLSVLLAG